MIAPPLTKGRARGGGVVRGKKIKLVSIGPQTCCSNFQGLPNYQKLGGFKQQGCILSQFWRPEVLNAGVGRVGSLERVYFKPLPKILGAASNPWLLRLINTSLASLLSHSRNFLYVSSALRSTGHLSLDVRHPDPRYYQVKILNVNLCKDIYPKEGHFHKPQTDIICMCVYYIFNSLLIHYNDQLPNHFLSVWKWTFLPWNLIEKGQYPLNRI